MQRLIRIVGIWLLAAAALAGCATGFTLNNQVQSYSTLTALPEPATYRFDRLPLAQMDPSQTQAELLADAPLFRVGLRRDDAAPRYAVQVSARVQQVLSPWASTWDGWDGWGWWGMGWHGPGWGMGFGGPFPSYYDRPWYQREVAVIVREIASHRVVYETHAVSDGPWRDNNAVLSAMFDAALQGFPNPPPGVRRVDMRVEPAPRAPR